METENPLKIKTPEPLVIGVTPPAEELPDVTWISVDNYHAIFTKGEAPRLTKEVSDICGM